MSRYVARFLFGQFRLGMGQGLGLLLGEPGLLEAFGEFEGIEGYGAHGAGNNPEKIGNAWLIPCLAPNTNRACRGCA